MDANGDQYSYLSISLGGGQTVDDCAQFCGEFPSPDLVGFEPSFARGICLCLYSGQNLPTPPAGKDVALASVSEGTGPIKGSTGSSGSCYAFAQVRKVSTFSNSLQPSFFISLLMSVLHYRVLGVLLLLHL